MLPFNRYPLKAAMKTPEQRSTVALVKCESYAEAEVLAAVRRGVDLVGGMEKFAAQGETVLIKPNVLVAAPPEQCVTTHPEVFRAVCVCLKETGCRVVFGDSPAIYSGWGKSGPTMRKAGLTAIAQSLGVLEADFENGMLIKNGKSLSNKMFIIASGVCEADGVISLPKLKTHGLTRITGAIKNQYGCVPGVNKGRYHARLPNVHDFSRLLADITSFVKPRLYIMDAVMAMEGNGPQHGEPRRLGLILVSTDPVAIDSVACKIINLNPLYVPTLVAGEAAGLGVWQYDRIDCIGDDIGLFITSDFKVVRQPAISVPDNKLTRMIKNLLVARPVILRKKCTRCGTCIRMCPVDPKAIAWVGARIVMPPKYRYGRCVRCFCCHEICPTGAIQVKTPLLGRLLPIATYLALFIANIRAKRNSKRAMANL
jgi:uncharacterized protein (DUF362 family)